MALYMGIDGGGSTLRVVVADDEMGEAARVERAQPSNPSAIGPDTARALVQGAMRDVLAGLDADHVRGVGIGIAGASAEHSADWLRETVRGVLPSAHVAASSDLEIALVGAHGARSGVILVAGTGSAAFGIGLDGRGLRVGGWGYLLGDEGSGYWIGSQALRVACQSYDLGMLSPLGRFMLDQLNLPDARALIRRVYGSGAPDVRGIAALAEPLIKWATGDIEAERIVYAAASHLGRLTDLLIARLDLIDPPIALAGGLLERDNLLRQALHGWLGRKDIPFPKHPPAIGAALLAKLSLEGTPNDH
ncbi:MAG: hypothetical protein IT323_16250 [Anaerolineae bacterium]|nr:hypothetical protein [Anaerolineae bacterium]